MEKLTLAFSPGFSAGDHQIEADIRCLDFTLACAYSPCPFRKGDNTLKLNSDTIGMFLKTVYVHSDIFQLQIIVGVNSDHLDGLSLRFPLALH